MSDFSGRRFWRFNLVRHPYFSGMSAMVFCHHHRVTYAECTIGNHVYHARYLEWLEAARGEFFRQLGTSFLQWQTRGLTFPIIECRLRYQAPARYDDVLAIEVWMTFVGGVRLNFAHRIRNPNGTVLVEADTFHACASLEGKPKRLPGELCAALQPYLEPAAA